DWGIGVKSLPEDSMDVIVLGSSHAQYSFNPTFFYQDTGTYSFVLGSACQPLEVSYEMLKEALKTQSPQVVILEVYTALPLRCICEADSSYIIAQYQMRDEEKYNTINFLPEEKAKTYYNEFLVYHNQWKYMTSLEDLKPSESLIEDISKINQSFGYIYLEQTKIDNSWYAEIHNSDLDVELDETDQLALNQIYELCKQEGIELFLYKTPIDSMDDENQSYLKKVWKWAEEKGVPYIDFFEESESLGYKMWIHSDSYHAYINGAEIITNTIAESINELYDLSHTSNELLEELYVDRGISDIFAYAKIEEDNHRLLKRLEKYDGEIMIYYKSVNNLPSWVRDSLTEITSGNFDETNNYFAIIENGEVIYESSESIEMSYNDKVISFTEDTCVVSDEVITNDSLAIILFNSTGDKIAITDLLDE
ncbi:MAG: hypothetical protein R3Y57_04275, partial [Erysipelotrichaceae bacterium]